MASVPRHAAQLAIVSISEEGTILTANERSEELFGYGPDELLGKDISCLVPPRLLERHLQLRQGYFSHPTRRFMALQHPFPAIRRDGTELWIKGSLSPTNTPAGLVVTCVFEEVPPP